MKGHYKGSFPDGKEFDSCCSLGAPIELPFNRVIPCSIEGVQRVKPGGKAKPTCPSAIVRGERGAGGVVPSNATRQFEVELRGIG